MRPVLLCIRVWLLAAGLAGCARDAAPARPWPLPGWPAQGVVELARGFEPQPLAELAAHLETGVQPPRGGRFESTETSGSAAAAELWFELPLPRASWKAGPFPCEWRTPLAADGALLLAERKSIVLLDGAKVWSQGKARVPGTHRAALGFRLDGAELVLCLDGAAEPSDALRLRARLTRGGTVEGRWRSELPDLTCDGVLVFPGVPETLACEIPPASRLAFTSVLSGAPGPGLLRVKLDERTILEVPHTEVRPSLPLRHELALDASGPHRLSFEVEGAGAVLVAAPLLVPLEVGKPGARPWNDPRPDLVLVLCDTFRADNLAEYGGDPELAPNLNQLTSRALRFLDARSTAAWTLPSIGSILSGVFPGQHGGTDLDRGVVSEVETLAEVLRESGYRTAAITDSGLFSHLYGQDQGFEWFEEVPAQRWHLGTTLELARARMAADDGRPLFLVVHTYRVHGPMRVGPQEDGKPWRDVLLKAFEARKARRLAANDPSAANDDELEQELTTDESDPELGSVGLRFYHDAVSDLDAKLGGWIDELERAGFLARGVLALTADHGNAYGEHDESGHGGTLYDVKLRVPLVFVGRGITARAVKGVVSLIDLAPTLAELAGAPPSATWLGRSLLSDQKPRPAYAFDLKRVHQQVALFAEGHKLLATDVNALEAGRPTHAFDLTQDPGEEQNLAESMSWPGQLGRALAESVELLLVPAAEARALELSPEARRQLEAIGYGE